MHFRYTASAATALAALALLGSAASGSVNRNDQYAAVSADSVPAFDAALLDPMWQKAIIAKDFEDLTARRSAPLATTAYLLYDASNLYVGFRANQDGVPIHAEHSTNDVGFGQDDAVGVCIDTSNSSQQVYCFESTPRAVRYQQASESTRYAPPWKAKAAVNGSSWAAMFVIPLKDLRAQGGAERTWRFNFIRICAATGDHYTWAYDGLMVDGQPPSWPISADARLWPELTALNIAAAAARPLPRLEVYGLESAGRDRDVFQQADNTFASKPVRRGGVDFTYPLTSTMAAVGTLNPDFSNVEVDQQTIVPQEFQRNLVEYRPFFAQGAQYFTPEQSSAVGGFFNAPDQVFYSPTIGEFGRGLKMEGTYGMQAVGLLDVRGVALDGTTLDDTAFGFKHQLSDRKFLYWLDGVLAHHDIGDDSTLDEGFGGRNLKTGLIYGFNQALETRRLSFDPSRQFAYERNGFVEIHKPNYEIYEGYQDVGPGYGPLDGFTTTSDARGGTYAIDFTGSTTRLKSWMGFVGGDRLLTRDGRVHEADLYANGDFVTSSLVHVNVNVGSSELNDPLLTGGVSMPFNQNTLTLGFRDGTPAPVDFSFGIGEFSTFYLQQFSASTSRQIGSRFSIQGTYAGTHERSNAIAVDGQLLRSIAIGESLGTDTNFTLALRTINGSGGFASPGKNFAAAFHSKFRNGNELFVNFGTPAAPATLDRLLIKYVLRIGSGAGA
jgi:cellulose/xylan binding protein with CBM9 domain